MDYDYTRWNIFFRKNDSSKLFVDRIKSIVPCRTLPSSGACVKAESVLIQQLTVNVSNFAQENRPFSTKWKIFQNYSTLHFTLMFKSLFLCSWDDFTLMFKLLFLSSWEHFQASLKFYLASSSVFFSLGVFKALKHLVFKSRDSFFLSRKLSYCNWNEQSNTMLSWIQ